MLKFSEIFEFSKEKFRKILILKEFEWFEWFGPSPTEPFNSAAGARVIERDHSDGLARGEGPAGDRATDDRTAALRPANRRAPAFAESGAATGDRT